MHLLSVFTQLQWFVKSIFISKTCLACGFGKEDEHLKDVGLEQQFNDIERFCACED